MRWLPANRAEALGALAALSDGTDVMAALQARQTAGQLTLTKR